MEFFIPKWVLWVFFVFLWIGVPIISLAKITHPLDGLLNLLIACFFFFIGTGILIGRFLM